MSQSNILLLNPISREPPPMYFGPPYGLALIAAVLENKGKTPVCLDFERESYKDMKDCILATIKKYKTKYLGISCQSSNRNYVYKILKEIKAERPDIYVILGGPFPSQKYNIFLKNFPVDFIVRGDGEITFNELIDTLEEGGNLNEVKGIAYLRNSEIVVTGEREKVMNLDNLPFPAFHLFFVREKLDTAKSHLQREIEQRKIENISGKRCTAFPNALMVLSSVGCLFSCAFCPMSGLKKGKYREHSPKVFVDFVEKLHNNFNQKYFVFGDNTFTLNMDKAKKICNEIIRRKLDILWICMTRTDYLDKELIFLMRKAGCLEISFGVESFSPKVQKSIGKKLNLDTVKNALEWCSEAGVKSMLMLMVGNLGETKNTIYETLINCRELEPNDVKLERTKVYPGTRIHDQFEEAGLIDDEFYLNSESKTPLFTLEHNEQRINYFKSMLKLRNVDLEFGGNCNNNCKYCKMPSGGRKKTTNEVKDALLQVAERAYEVTLCNKDPCIRGDFLEILDYAHSIGISKLNIETNARMFSSSEFLKKTDFSKIKKILVPIWSVKKELFEELTSTPCSYRQTLVGLKKLLSYTEKLQIIAKVPIIKENYQDLRLIVEKLKNLGVKNFRLIYEPTEDYDFPNPRDFKSYLEEVLYFLRSNNLKFSVRGVPYCTTPAFEDYIEDIQRPFDEIFDLKGNLINEGKERRKRRIKDKNCSECSFHSICEGFWS